MTEPELRTCDDALLAAIINATPYDFTTPFDFARLAGEPEPESWGPVYNIKRKRGQSVSDAVRQAQAAAWKREPVFHTNSPSGQAFEFSAAKHRARLKAEFAAQCNRERLTWATGQAIVDAYEEAMKIKRKREAVNTNVMTARAAKPHYVYRAGQWVQLLRAA